MTTASGVGKAWSWSFSCLPAASLKPFGTTKRSSRPQPRRTGMGIVSRLVRGSHVRPALRDTVTAGQGEEEEEFSDKKQR